ncbi:unnamed protein product [Victoria cruziana]
MKNVCKGGLDRRLQNAIGNLVAWGRCDGLGRLLSRLRSVGDRTIGMSSFGDWLPYQFSLKTGLSTF